MKYYFCNTKDHTKQVFTDEQSPKCNQCGAVMTYGKFTDDIINGTILRPGPHKALDGSTYHLDKTFIIEF